MSAEDYFDIERAVAFKLVDGDVYLARDGNYLVRLAARYQGYLAEFEFRGEVRLTFDLTQPGPSAVVQLPQVCAEGEQAGLGPTIRLNELPAVDAVTTGPQTSILTLTLEGKDSDEQPVNGDLIIREVTDWAKKQQVVTIEGTYLPQFLKWPPETAAWARRLSVYKNAGEYYAVTEGAEPQDAEGQRPPPGERPRVASVLAGLPKPGAR